MWNVGKLALCMVCLTGCADSRDGGRDSGIVLGDDGGPALPYAGIVNIVQANGNLGIVQGIFLQATAESASCITVAEIGSCRSYVCDGATAPTLTSAGELRVMLGGGELRTLIYDSSLQSYYWSAERTVFAAGDVLTVQATGADVPAFDATVTAPPPLSTSLPTFATRAADLTVSWTPPSNAQRIALTIFPSVTGEPSIMCQTNASAGTIRVPAALLSDLSPGTVSVGLGATNRAERAAGQYAVVMNATDTRSGPLELE
jgi:hypothetical protein